MPQLAMNVSSVSEVSALTVCGTVLPASSSTQASRLPVSPAVVLPVSAGSPVELLPVSVAGGSPVELLPVSVAGGSPLLLLSAGGGPSSLVESGSGGGPLSDEPVSGSGGIDVVVNIGIVVTC